MKTKEIEGILWLRLGDGSDYEQLGSDLGAVASILNDAYLGGNIAARQGGLTSANYRGANYISLYWGDEDGNLNRSLSDDEFEDLLENIQ